MNRRRKVRWIPETAGFALDAHDLAVEALSNAIRDRMFRESEHAVEMTLELRGDLLHRLEPRAHGPAIPVGEKALHGGRLAVRPQRAQGFLDRPGPPDFEIQRLERGEGVGVVLGSVLVTEQPHVLDTVQRRVIAVAEKLPVFLFAN